MKEIVEGALFWGALLVGLAVYAVVGWKLMREARRGKLNRFVAVIVYGAAAPFLAIVPVLLACLARWLGNLAGFPIFPRASADDGIMVGIGIFGIVIGFGATVLFALVMIFQALTGSGDANLEAKD